MRKFLFLIIISLFVSNVASAAMLCCMDTSVEISAETKQQSDDKMPCHGDDNSSDTSSSSQCDCEGCFQFATLTQPLLAVTEALAFSLGSDLSTFHSLDLSSIFYPPRPNHALIARCSARTILFGFNLTCLFQVLGVWVCLVE